MVKHPILAAIVQYNWGGADDLVAGFALSLIARGWCVRGLVQESIESTHGCELVLVDLGQGEVFDISQHLGSGAMACCLDTGKLTEAGGVLRRIVEEGADLAVINRFSSLEAEGKGFAAELLAIAGQGIPLLTIVPQRHLTAWREFTGGMATELEPDIRLLERWFHGHSGGLGSAPEALARVLVSQHE